MATDKTIAEKLQLIAENLPKVYAALGVVPDMVIKYSGKHTATLYN